MAEKEKNHRYQMKQIRTKLQERLKTDKIKFEDKIKKLNSQLTDARNEAKISVNGGDPLTQRKLEEEIRALKTKEKDLLKRLNRITFSFKKVDIQREKNMNQLKEQLQVKNKEINRLEKV